MKYREFTCLNCGAKVIDMSRTKNKKFCDMHCNQAYYYKKKQGELDKVPTNPCIHNIAVICDLQKCGTCGWNPKVEKKRKEALGCG